jgi:low affinity Fe/Cu permease
VKELFHRIAVAVSKKVGSPTTFLLAVLIVLIWAITGPMFGFSDTWQLVINTGTTIVTFLMVFLIQNTQNRDGLAMQIKLDELIKANQNARDALVDLEDLTDQEIDALQEDFKRMREQKYSFASEKLHKRLLAEHQRRRKKS